MTIHTLVVTVEKFTDWQGKPAARLDLRTKHATKPGPDLHLYAGVDSPLAKLGVGAKVTIQAQRV